MRRLLEISSEALLQSLSRDDVQRRLPEKATLNSSRLLQLNGASFCKAGIKPGAGGSRVPVRHASGFPAEHRLLTRDAPVIAGQLAALAEHTMTRHHERHRVLANRSSNGA